MKWNGVQFIVNIKRLTFDGIWRGPICVKKMNERGKSQRVGNASGNSSRAVFARLLPEPIDISLPSLLWVPFSINCFCVFCLLSPLTLLLLLTVTILTYLLQLLVELSWVKLSSSFLSNALVCCFLLLSLLHRMVTSVQC